MDLQFSKVVAFMLLALHSAFPKRDTRFCIHPVDGIVRYNLTTHECKNASVREIITPAPATKRPRYTGKCEGPDDEFLCGGKVECGRLSRRRCCGRNSYQPVEQTCCILMEYDGKIYNKPEKDNVCCDHKLYPRYPDQIPCLHAAKNDPMWRPRTLKNLDNRYKLCQDFSNAYLLRIGRKQGNSYQINGTHVRFSKKYVKVTNGRNFSQPMPVDRYTPKRKLTGKRHVIVLSHDDDKSNALDFYLHSKDLVIKIKGNAKKRMKIFKKALKLMRNC